MFVVNNNIQSFINTITEDIKRGAPSSSGNLRSSITANVVMLDNGFTIDISMAEYGYYQDQGVDGTKKSWGAPYKFSKMPPPSKLDGWMVRNGIAPRDAGGKFTSRKGLAFVIARSIMENGIKPKNFIQPVLTNKLERLGELVAESLLEDFEKKINENK